MPRLPNVSKEKELPADELNLVEVPDATEGREDKPDNTPQLTDVPEKTNQLETTPEASPEKEEKPSDNIEENCVMIGDQKIEIKPTKLKYFRNKAASGYGIIKLIPLHELLTYDKGMVDETRSADQLLYDFLVAVFDDSTFVRDHYDDLDADTIDRIVKIFGRINHVDEKEEAARKNKEAQAQAKR